MTTLSVKANAKPSLQPMLLPLSNPPNRREKIFITKFPYLANVIIIYRNKNISLPLRGRASLFLCTKNNFDWKYSDFEHLFNHQTFFKVILSDKYINSTSKL